MNKRLLILFFLSLFFDGALAQVKIITSKEEAIRKNKYQIITTKESDKQTTPAAWVAKEKKPEHTAAPTLEQENDTDEFFDSENPEKTVYAENPEYNNYFADELINNIKDNLGTRYQSGGTTKNGFDCSGLVFATFSKWNIILPRTSNEQSRMGLRINPTEAKKGDLIFFRTNGRRVINHVGMIIDTDNEGITFIHSSTHLGVIISNTKEGYYKKTFAQVNRILQTP